MGATRVEVGRWWLIMGWGLVLLLLALLTGHVLIEISHGGHSGRELDTLSVSFLITPAAFPVLLLPALWLLRPLYEGGWIGKAFIALGWLGAGALIVVGIDFLVALRQWEPSGWIDLGGVELLVSALLALGSAGILGTIIGLWAATGTRALYRERLALIGGLLGFPVGTALGAAAFEITLAIASGGGRLVGSLLFTTFSIVIPFGLLTKSIWGVFDHTAPERNIADRENVVVFEPLEPA